MAGLFSYFTLPIKNFPNIEFPAGDGHGHRNRRRAGGDGDPGHPAGRGRRWPASPTSQSIALDGHARASSITRIQFDLGEEPAEGHRRRPRQGRPDPQPAAARDRPADRRSGSTSTTSRSSPMRSSAPAHVGRRPLLVRRQHHLPHAAGASRASARSPASAASTARSTSSSIPTRMAAQGLTAPQINARAGAGQRRRRRRPGAGRRARADAAGAGRGDQRRADPQPHHSRRPAAASCKLSDVADVGDGTGRGARLRASSTAGRWSASRSPRPRTPARSRPRTPSTRRSRRAARPAANPGRPRSPRSSPTVDDTRGSFAATLHTMLEGMALAALVVWLFLRDWRATAVTAVAMPVSLIPTFAFMALVGFSLEHRHPAGADAGDRHPGRRRHRRDREHRETGARRHAALSRPRWRAPTRSAWPWSPPPPPSWWCSCRSSFMPGIPGQFFKEFGLTVSVAVLFSLVVARLLTPLLAAYFLKPKAAASRARRCRRFYTRVAELGARPPRSSPADRRR